jgi:hypothetical protein
MKKTAGNNNSKRKVNKKKKQNFVGRGFHMRDVFIEKGKKLFLHSPQ